MLAAGFKSFSGGMAARLNLIEALVLLAWLVMVATGPLYTHELQESLDHRWRGIDWVAHR